MAEKILIIDGRFYEELSDELVKGASAVLKKRRVAFDRLTVPGAFEIPAAIRMAMDSGKYGGYVALGCVIRGETTHYDYVCAESARGLQELSVRHGLAIGYGILTTEDEKQAWKRAAVSKGNKGGAAAEAALRMMEVKAKFGVKE